MSVGAAVAAEIYDAWDASLLGLRGRCSNCNGDGTDPLGFRSHTRTCPISVAATRVAEVVVRLRAPMRIQRKRTKGWRMPEGAIYVGRPSRWGNVWAEGERGARVDRYRDILVNWNHDTLTRWLEPLRGHDVACWCPLDQPCHADVLLELANR